MNCAICTDPSSNHTTEQHQEAERIMCYDCGIVEVKDEDERCAECVQAEGEYRIVCACMMIDGEWQLCGDHLSEQAAYYEPDEGGNG